LSVFSKQAQFAAEILQKQTEATEEGLLVIDWIAARTECDALPQRMAIYGKVSMGAVNVGMGATVKS
jgi:hypothetical protein